MCGEKSGFCQRSILHLGSPPRMRGKAIVIQRVDRLGGITPACAGKRTPLLTPRSVTWDHPRVCGEKPESGRWGEQDAGSPPRMRGKAPRFLIAKGLFRITPAYAGKSVKVNEPDCLPRDHPRVCGEKTSSNVPERKNPGSPPRMQGKGCPLLFRYYFIGITPACAGKSYSPPQGSKRQGDHPRVCGEKSVQSSAVWCIPGSPPRMRGKARYIAASVALFWDHPRVCGEKASQTLLPTEAQGSPPRMRGKAILPSLAPAT